MFLTSTIIDNIQWLHVYIVKLSFIIHERMQLSNNENKKPTPAFVYNDLDAILKIWKRYFNFHFFSSPGRMSGELLSYPRRRRGRGRGLARVQKL